MAVGHFFKPQMGIAASENAKFKSSVLIFNFESS